MTNPALCNDKLVSQYSARSGSPCDDKSSHEAGGGHLGVHKTLGEGASANKSLIHGQLEVFSEDIPCAVLWYNCGTKWL